MKQLVTNSFELGDPFEVVIHFCHCLEAPDPVARIRIGDEELLILAIVVVTEDSQPLRVLVYPDFYNKFQRQRDDEGTIGELLNLLVDNVPGFRIKFPNMAETDKEIQRITKGAAMKDVLIRRDSDDAQGISDCTQ